MIDLRLGDCLEVMKTLDAGSVDAVATDPPYGLEFMGKDWDSFRGEAWRSGAGMSKPGIGDRPIPWPSFGSGDSAKATCALCGGRMRGKKKCLCLNPEWRVKGQPLHARNGRLEQMRSFQRFNEAWVAECFRVMKPGSYLMAFGGTRTFHRLICAIEDAGFEIRDCLMWLYGSGFPKGKGCLKPAWEPITLARKPGGKIKPLGIEECRVGTTVETWPASRSYGTKGKKFNNYSEQEAQTQETGDAPDGRWPPNLLLQHHPDCNGECHPECVVRVLGEQSGESRSISTKRCRNPRIDTTQYRNGGARYGDSSEYDDIGTAARFYPQFRYAAKASRRERNAGLEGMEVRRSVDDDWVSESRKEAAGGGKPSPQANHHPTVKPLAIMEWLVKLACPEGGTVLDPFVGSGSTGVACKRNNRSFIGIDSDAQWLPIAQKRIAAEEAKMSLFAGVEA